MTATAPQATSGKQQYLETLEREFNTTVKVLRAYPAGKEALQPHAKCKNAVSLAWIFAGEMGMLHTAITTGFDWSKPPKMPPAPATMAETITAFEGMYKQLVPAIKALSDEQLATETVQFPTGPGQMGTPTKMQFLWFVLSDMIHHRGQFSIYLRMADGKLPSIYGPTADEPWM